MMRLFTYIFLLSFTITIAQNNFEQGKTSFMNGKYEIAEPLLQAHYKNNPSDLNTVEYLGDLACYKKDWDKAKGYYKQLVEAQPDNANYQYKYGGVLGMISLSVSKFKALSLIDDIEEAFLKAVELDATHIDARWALVELYMKLPGILGGSTKKALKFANELEHLSEVDGYLAKGFIYDYKNDYLNSEANYKKAVEVGGSATCYQKLTDLYLKHQQKEAAINTLETAYKKHPKSDFLAQINLLKNGAD